jgi:hypothetical protein
VRLWCFLIHIYIERELAESNSGVSDDDEAHALRHIMMLCWVRPALPCPVLYLLLTESRLLSSKACRGEPSGVLSLSQQPKTQSPAATSPEAMTQASKQASSKSQ